MIINKSPDFLPDRNKITSINTKNEIISLKEHSHFLNQGAGNRNITERDLLLYKEYVNKRVFCVDGTGATSNLLYIDDNNINQQGILLENGFDSVIAQVKEEIEIINPTADCGNCAFWSELGDIIGVLHGGYKSIFGVVNNDFGIIFNTVEKLKKLGNIKEFNFYMGPMAGQYFELPENYLDDISKVVMKEYKLDINNYKRKSKYEGKIYFNLRKLKLDIFKAHGIKFNSSESNKKDKYINYYSNKITNTLESIEPTSRDYHNFQKIIKINSQLLNNFNKLNLNEILNLKNELYKLLDNFKGYKSEYLKSYFDNDYRLALIVSNYKK